MEAILFVGHGSRDEEGNQELLAFTEKVAQYLQEPIIETCFLELTQPDIPHGVARCVEQGATHIRVIPIMLFAAGHSKVHIPFAIHEAKEKVPNVEFSYGRPFGVEKEILPILKRRIHEHAMLADKTLDNREDLAILLVGRGSSDGDANSDLYKIARLLWEKMPVKWVESAFIGVTHPRFEEGLKRCEQMGASRCIVVPYFLFTGVLIKRMDDLLRKFSATGGGLPVKMSTYLGLDEDLVHVLLDRVQEVAQGGGEDWEALVAKAQADGHHPHHHHDHDHTHDHRDHGHSHPSIDFSGSDSPQVITSSVRHQGGK
ncbi:sirohydrochlorin chelatase [Marininema halotolerans]|uniref:Sirohydrochlorin cobaltochelatase n=1 Tax=Marininema halotolerans TaxID=1155944 RepID=A0A1I6QLH8_9BACL|nr:sirohydrochlorin chelatase [Marininema halotolerans]SFS53314.1 sirohydrochlorin cobaltochelatase [Marininema halotolerans]